MSTEERVVLTAELKDAASAPLDNLSKKVDKAASSVDKASKKMATTTGKASTATSAGLVGVGTSMTKMQRLATTGIGKVGSAVGSMNTRLQAGTGAMGKMTRAVNTGGQNMANGFRSPTRAADTFIGRVGAIGGTAAKAATPMLNAARNMADGFRSPAAAASSFTGAMGTFGGHARRASDSVSGAFSSVGSRVSSAFGGVNAAISGSAGSVGNIVSAAGRAGTAINTHIGGALGNVTSAAGKTAAILGGTLAGIALQGGFSRALNIEDAQAKLTGLGHSTKSVEDIMANASASVSGTAFGLGDAAAVAAGTVAAGVKPGKDLERSLRLIGDGATIAGMGMGEMGSIWNKVASSDMIQGDVLAQLGDRGIPILQLLAKETGKSATEVKKMASKGEINFATFQNAMEKGMGGAALKSGETFRGAMANTRSALGRIGETFLKPFLTLIKAGFNGLIPLFDAFNAAIKPAFAALGAWADKTGPKVTAWAQNIAKGIKGVIDLVIGGQFTDGFREVFNVEEDSALVEKLFGIRDAFQSVIDVLFKNDVSGIVERTFGNHGEISAFDNALLSIRANFDNIKNALMPLAGLALAFFSKFMGGIPIIGRFLPVLNPVVGLILGLLAQSPELRAALGGAFMEIMGAVTKVGIALTPLIPVIGKIIGEGAKLVAVIVEKLTPFLPALATGILSVVAGIKIWGVYQNILNAAVWANTRAMLANPTTWIILGIVALIAAIVLLVTHWDKVTATLKNVWGGFLNWGREVIDGFANWWGEVWGGMVNGLKDLWAGISSWWTGIWDSVKSIAGAFIDGAISLFLNFHPVGLIIKHWEPITQFFADLWAGLLAGMGVLWEGAKAVFAAGMEWIDRFLWNAATIIVTLFQPVLDFWDSHLLPGLQVVGDFFVQIFQWIMDNAVTPFVNGIQSGVQLILDFWNNTFMPGLQAVGDFFAGVWQAMTDAVTLAVSWIVLKLQEIIAFWSGVFLGALNLLRDTFTNIFNWILNNVINPVVSGIRAVFDGLIGFWTGTLQPAAQRVGDWFTNTIGSAISGVTGFIDTLKSGFDGFISFWGSTLKPVVDAIASAFGRVSDVIGGAVNAVKDFAKNPFGGLQAKLGIEVGADGRGAMPARNSGGGVYMSGGGVVPGYAPGVDNIPAVLSRGEAVLVPELVRAIGPRKIMALNHKYSGGRAAGAGPAAAPLSAALSSVPTLKASGGAVLTAAPAATGLVTAPAPSVSVQQFSVTTETPTSTTQITVAEGAVQIIIQTNGEGITSDEVNSVKEGIEEVFEDIRRRGY